LSTMFIIRINILTNQGRLIDIAQASDQLNISVLSAPVTKYYMFYPKRPGSKKTIIQALGMGNYQPPVYGAAANFQIENIATAY
jgi:hypothetical protein